MHAHGVAIASRHWFWIVFIFCSYLRSINFYRETGEGCESGANDWFAAMESVIANLIYTGTFNVPVVGHSLLAAGELSGSQVLLNAAGWARRTIPSRDVGLLDGIRLSSFAWQRR